MFSISQLKPAPAPTAATAAPIDGAKDADGQKLPAAKAEDWLCSCGTTNPGRQTRCGSCQRWKGGKRQVVPRPRKKPLPYEEGLTSWECDKCGNKVLANKSRCGQCHHWRGGKRKCGWTIKGKGDDGSIPWHLEWSCCGVKYSPDKRRCECAQRDFPFSYRKTHFPPSRW